MGIVVVTPQIVSWGREHVNHPLHVLQGNLGKRVTGEGIFAGMVKVVMKKIIVEVSGVNVIRAVKKATDIGMQTVALLGKEGGALKGMCDFELIVPAKTADRIQEIHMMVLHIIIEGMESLLFPTS